MGNEKIELVVIGKVKRIQGSNAELRILVISDFPERFKSLNRIYLVNQKTQERFTEHIEDVRLEDDDVILKLKGIDERKDAFKYRKFLIAIPIEERVKLPEDVYYIDEIEGAKVLTENGELLGFVDYVMQTGSVDIYVIKSGKKEIMIPAKKEYIISVDIEKQQIIVRLPEGLMEINEKSAK